MLGRLVLDPPPWRCSAAGCDAGVAPGRVFCAECWERVPDGDRAAIAADWVFGIGRHLQPKAVRRAIGRAVRSVGLVTSRRAAGAG